MKNLILCFRHSAIYNNEKYSNTFCGLGDIMKGFISCYNICVKNKYNFYLNFNGHSLKNFLNFKKFNWEGSFPSKIRFVNGSDLENYIIKSNEDNLFLMTDGSKSYDYSPGLTDSFEEVFFTNPKVLKKISEIEVPKSFKVFHARFGDGSMVCQEFLDDYYLRDFSHPHSSYDWYKSIDIKEAYKFILKNFKEELSSCNFICSDHLSFKNFISEMFDIKYINSESVHLGLKGLKQKQIIDTLCDFYMLYKAQDATCISQYPYGKRPSGFCYWIDQILFKQFKHFSIDPRWNSIYPLVSA